MSPGLLTPRTPAEAPSAVTWAVVELPSPLDHLAPRATTLVPVLGDRSRDDSDLRRLVTGIVFSGLVSIAVLGALLTWY